MPKIKNKLFQPLNILLEGEKTLYLQSRGDGTVSRSDLDSSHLQSLIKAGDIAVIHAVRQTERPTRARRRTE